MEKITGGDDRKELLMPPMISRLISFSLGVCHPGINFSSKRFLYVHHEYSFFIHIVVNRIKRQYPEPAARHLSSLPCRFSPPATSSSSRCVKPHRLPSRTSAHLRYLRTVSTICFKVSSGMSCLWVVRTGCNQFDPHLRSRQCQPRKSWFLEQGLICPLLSLLFRS